MLRCRRFLAAGCVSGIRTRAGEQSARIAARRTDNHLDIETIDWLEGFLKTFNGR